MPTRRGRRCARSSASTVSGAFAGAAPTPIEVLEYFGDLGIPISEAWGMSELTCVATTTHPGTTAGHGGKPIPGVEVRLADDGELLARGRS